MGKLFKQKEYNTKFRTNKIQSTRNKICNTTRTMSFKVHESLKRLLEFSRKIYAKL